MVESGLDARWRTLIANNPQLLQFNRVPCGYCALPQGPEGCREYLNCTEAQEGGCQWFLTDPEDERMLIQISKRTRQHRCQAEASAEAGRTVQAGKYEVLARRSEAMEAELRRQLREAREQLRTTAVEELDEAIRLMERLEEENLQLRSEVKLLRKRLQEGGNVFVHAPVPGTERPQLTIMSSEQFQEGTQ